MVSNNSAIAAIRSILVALLLLVSVNPVVSLSRPILATTGSSDRGSAGLRGVVRVRSLQNNAFFSSTALRGGDGDELSHEFIDSHPTDINNNSHDSELKSYASEASALFGNLRIPAALFAGAAAQQAFAMPISSTASEGLKIGIVKRLYALLMVGCLASQIVTVVVSTCCMTAMALGPVHKTKAKSVGDLLDSEYDLEWISVRLCFLGGLGCYAIAVGLRAWVTIVCPVFATASLGVIISSTLLCLAFVRNSLRFRGDDFLVKMPLQFAKLVFQRAKKDGMFALAMITHLITWIHIVMNIPHIWTYLATYHSLPCP